MKREEKLKLADEIYSLLDEKSITNADKRKVLSACYGKITRAIKNKQAYKKEDE